jgi:hypothetical protein
MFWELWRRTDPQAQGEIMSEDHVNEWADMGSAANFRACLEWTRSLRVEVKMNGAGYSTPGFSA